MIITCKGEQLILSHERSIYWEAKKMLIISDLHLGKSAHFRKHGIQVPSTVALSDLDRLTRLIHQHRPEILLITGDMFHHSMNSDILNFSEWRKSFPQLQIVLVKGNHDRLKNKDYEMLNIEVYSKEYLQNPFRFIHDQPEEKDDYYNISGHIHPGVKVYGKARQQLHLPCFYFGRDAAILPAFSLFTGLSRVIPEKEDRFFAITPDRVIAV